LSLPLLLGLQSSLLSPLEQGDFVVFCASTDNPRKLLLGSCGRLDQ